MRCKKFKTARQRDSSLKICTLPGEDIDAIDLAVGPGVLLGEPPSKVARLVPSPAAEENPTSADWAPWDSGRKVEHENITLRFR